VRTPFVVLALLVVGVPRPLSAQVLRHLGVDGVIARVRFSSATPGGGEALSGVVVGGSGRLALGRVSLEAFYAQGHLSADTGNAPARDVVDGSAFLVVRPADWLAFKAGPHLRAYVAPGGTERWVLWEGRVFAEAPVFADVLRARVGGWAALASGVNSDLGAGGGRGGEIGLALRPPRSPLLVRLSYAVDRVAMRSGGRTETLESVMLTIGVGGR
jgi:hypothetical protein